jgi:hypothetical protein
MDIRDFAGVNNLFEKPNGEKMSHQELYTKVVNGIGLEVCEKYIPVSIEKLRDALQVDPHLNSIALKKWDNAANRAFRHTFRLIKVDTISLSEAVCTLKQAARMLVERDYPEYTEYTEMQKEKTFI